MASDDEQRLNKRTTRWIEWKGERRRFIEVCREMKVSPSVAWGRLQMGWEVERAFTERVRQAGHIRQARSARQAAESNILNGIPRDGVFRSVRRIMREISAEDESRPAVYRALRSLRNRGLAEQHELFETWRIIV